MSLHPLFREICEVHGMIPTQADECPTCHVDMPQTWADPFGNDTEHECPRCGRQVRLERSGQEWDRYYSLRYAADVRQPSPRIVVLKEGRKNAGRASNGATSDLVVIGRRGAA